MQIQIGAEQRAVCRSPLHFRPLLVGLRLPSRPSRSRPSEIERRSRAGKHLLAFNCHRQQCHTRFSLDSTARLLVEARYFDTPPAPPRISAPATQSAASRTAITRIFPVLAAATALRDVVLRCLVLSYTLDRQRGIVHVRRETGCVSTVVRARRIRETDFAQTVDDFASSFCGLALFPLLTVSPHHS